MFNILIIGDIYASVGRRAVHSLLPTLREELAIDLVIANGENAAGGNGLTPAIFGELQAAGIDIVTSGNHIWDKKEILPVLDCEPALLRPANYPAGVPGHGHLITERKGVRVGVVNLAGRTFMPPVDCPFHAADALLAGLTGQYDICLVDFHAEATSEKMALGWYLDGRVTAVVGTHTHIQTSDERILTQGTAYITDVGMVGPWNSVLGVKHDIVLQKFLTGMPARFDAAKGTAVFDALLIAADPASGRASSVQRIQRLVD